MSCALNIGGGKDINDSSATEILGFTYSSGQVVLVGDKLMITWVIKDSLDTNLRFRWGIGIHAAQFTDENSITFQVKEAEGTVAGWISIQKLIGAFESVRGEFDFEIQK